MLLLLSCLCLGALFCNICLVWSDVLIDFIEVTILSSSLFILLCFCVSSICERKASGIAERSTITIWFLHICLTLFRMGLSKVAHVMGGGKKSLFLKICHTYPTIKKLVTVMPYLRKSQKIYSADINIFSKVIAFWHAYAPVNLLHFFRTPFPKNTSPLNGCFCIYHDSIRWVC